MIGLVWAWRASSLRCSVAAAVGEMSVVDLSGASGFCADCCFWGTDFGFMPKEAM